MTPRDQHLLFSRYPLDGVVRIGSTDAPTPYHIYDGSMLFIGGTADGTRARELLRGERLTPILDDQGSALMALWVCNFTAASLDPHHELQCSIFASPQPEPPVKAHPFAIFRLLALNPRAVMVCHGLWNNTPLVVQYNRSHLGLNAHLCASRISVTEAAEEGRMQFGFDDFEGGGCIAEGDILIPGRQGRRILLDLLRHVGVGGTLNAARSPFIHVPVANAITPDLPENRVAHTYAVNDSQVLRYYDGSQDHLAIHHPLYAALRFRPAFVQQAEGVRFVYLRPEAMPVPAAAV
ncbi:MAG: hypothetical protein JNL42_14035 [Anaerolineae bacterium]|nr:hypothetical protein [Anaerolineae bacterium]